MLPRPRAIRGRVNAARGISRRAIFECEGPIRKAVCRIASGVDIKNHTFLSNISGGWWRCVPQRGASRSGHGHRAGPTRIRREPGGAESIRRQGLEAEAGSSAPGVAHIFHMKAAAEPCKRVHGGGFMEARPEW